MTPDELIELAKKHGIHFSGSNNGTEWRKVLSGSNETHFLAFCTELTARARAEAFVECAKIAYEEELDKEKK